jgi:tRNA-binding EMAP/Myf-like protein
LKKHPNANKLRVCQVSDGKDSVQVVCGAANAHEGMRTILAQVGSKTPRGLEIKAAQLRGVDSHGMLCSAKDLAISDEAGIVDLPQSVELGTVFKDVQTSYLSSTPWYEYKLVEQFFEDKSGNINVSRDGSELDGKLLSQTYFHNGQYLYRHF